MSFPEFVKGRSTNFHYLSFSRLFLLPSKMAQRAFVTKNLASYLQLVINGLSHLTHKQEQQSTALSEGFNSAKEYIEKTVAELKTQNQELAKDQKVQQSSERDHRQKQKEDFADLRTEIATLPGVHKALIKALIENQKVHQTSERDHREKQKEDLADLRAQIATLEGVHKALITALIENQVHQTSDSGHKQSKSSRPVRPKPLDRFSPSQSSQRVSKTSSGPRRCRIVPSTTRLLRSTNKVWVIEILWP